MDYAALAKQFGGTTTPPTDYNALASKFGGKPGIFQPVKPVSTSPFNPNTPNSQFIDPNATSKTDLHIGSSSTQGFKDAGNKISDSFKSGINQVKEGVKQVGNTSGNPLDLITGAGKVGAGIIGAATAPLAPLTESLLSGPVSQAANKISDNKTVQDFANSKVGQGVANAAENVSNYATIVGTVGGAMEVAPKIPGALTELADKTIGKASVAGDIAKAGIKPTNDVLDIVKPKLTPTEEAVAKAQGRGTTTGKIFKNTEITPTPKETEMANVAKEAGVSSSNTFDQNIKVMKDFQKTSAEKIRTGLQEADKTDPLNFNQPQFKGQLGSVMNGIEKPITIVGDSAKIATKFKTAVMKLADTVTPTREGLLDLRQGLDRIINDQLPGNIYSKDTPLGQYVKATRQAITDFTEQKMPDGKLPDGSSFKGELRKQSLLYDAIDNVAEKAPKTGESARPIVGKAINFAKKHPVATALGTLGAEKVAKSLGIPFLP